MKIRILSCILIIVFLVAYLFFYFPQVYSFIYFIKNDTYRILGWVALVVSGCIPIELIGTAYKVKDEKKMLRNIMPVLVIVVAAIMTYYLPEELIKPNNDIVKSILIQRIALPFFVLLFIWTMENLSRIMDDMGLGKKNDLR